MYPMTLFETGESNGSISLFKLLEDEAYDIDGLTTDIKLEDLFLRSVEVDTEMHGTFKGQCKA